MRQAKGLVFLVGCAGLLASCGPSPEKAAERAADDAHAVAMVKRMNEVPFVPVSPQAITAQDVSRLGLADDNCVFRAGDAADAPTLFLGQKDRGFVKIDGKVIPLAAKSGSATLPGGVHASYIGLSGWIELLAQAGEDGSAPGGQPAWPSRLVFHDSKERVAFQASGMVSCSQGSAETA